MEDRNNTKKPSSSNNGSRGASTRGEERGPGLDGDALARRLSDGMFRRLYNQTPLMMHSMDALGRLITVNDYWLVNMGCTRREVLGRPFADFLTPQSKQYAAEVILPDFFAKGWCHDVEYQMVRKSGEIMTVSLSAVMDKDAQGDPCSMEFLIDITQKKRSEEMLRLGEDRLEALLAVAELEDCSEDEIIDRVLEDAVRLTKSKGGYFHFIHEDQRHLRLYAWSRDVIKACKAQTLQKYPLDQAGIWADCARAGAPQVHNDYESVPHRRGVPEGHIPIVRHMSVPIFEKGNMIAVIGVGNKETPYDDSDVRQLTLFSHSMWRLIQRKRGEEEKQNLELRLRQAQKLEAMGTLAGGIAHDFNNILSPIIGYAELELEEAQREKRPADALEAILEAGRRARDLVKQILIFSRNEKHDIGPVRIQTIIKESIKLLRSSLPSTIAITQIIDEKCSPALAEPTQIHQIIMNLCTNSYHAMQEEGGVLDITLRDIVLSAQNVAAFPSLPPGKYLRLSVSDTGVGMDAEVMERIFEPYFTTRTQEEGTGLGLSVVHGIVNAFGGAIQVRSQPGRGTVFHIFLPSIPAESMQEDHPPMERIVGGDERVLVVDDEDLMASMVHNMLERMGYRVTSCTDPSEALSLFQQAPWDFDLVFTDLTMPRLTGVQLCKRLHEIRPEIPVIMCTGFGGTANKQKAMAAGAVLVMEKPIVIREAAAAVRQALDNAQESAATSP